jgi:hypothetical protein
MKTNRLTTAAVTAVAALLALSVQAGARPSSAPLEGEGKGLKLVANLDTGSGTDMEFTTIKGHEYGFVASRTVADGVTGGLNVVNVDNPEKPKLVAKLPCNLNQGDIQISHDNKTVIMAADAAGGPDACLMVGQAGFMTIDVSNPLKPKAIGTAMIPRGSHNTTAHPTKPYVYNSDSDGGASRGEVQIWSIKNPAKPELVTTLQNLPHSPHDLSFNKDGTRMITAARTAVHYYDTTDPENPTLISATPCPGCQLAHDAKITPDGKWAIIGGIYEPNEVVFASEGQTAPGSCTSHVFDISPDSKKLAISWYSAGTRYLDISNPAGATFGENTSPAGGVTELGWFVPAGADSWSSKFHKGPYIYSNDIVRGFDVYKIEK